MILKQEIDGIHLVLSQLEFELMDKFMIKNGVGHGEMREVTKRWREAKEKYARDHS